MVQQRPETNNRDGARSADSRGAAFLTGNRNGIYIAVLLIITICAFGFIVTPLAVKARNVRLKLERAEAELDGKLKLESGLQGLIKKYKSDLKLAEEVMFTDRDIATFLENFSDFTRQANMTPVSIVGMSVKPVPLSTESEKALMALDKDKKKENAKKKMADELPGLLMKPMEIKIRGGYLDLVNFLISLEKYKQLLTINNLNISIAREGYPMLDAGFILYLYKMESPKNEDGDKEA